MELNASVDAKKKSPSPCCPHEETLQSWLSKVCPVKSLIRQHKCAGRSESSLGARPKVHFLTLQLILPYITEFREKVW